MKTTTTAELVFVPAPAAGHLFSAVELAKQLVTHDQRLSVTICVTTMLTAGFKAAIDPTADDSSVASRIRLIDLPIVKLPPNTNPSETLPSILEASSASIKKIASDIIRRRTESSDDSPRLAGFVIDMFCTRMIDVAGELGVPCYVFYTSGANFLGFMLHLQALYDEGKLGDLAELKDNGFEMEIPSLKKPLPCKCLPSAVVEKEWLPLLIDNTRRLREVRGIAVNSFLELEPHAIDFLSTGGIIPPVYPVGPILNLKAVQGNEEVMEWLDDQPAASVVFLCFGSMGSFGKEQVTEIAVALERCGQRFLWSLRRSPEAGKVGPPSEYEDFDEAPLPAGFLDRVSGIGKVIGWAPQTAVLRHEAVGGFVSHCGWNSVLESIWFGVPVGAWPMYAEQQLNAFQLVEELGLAEEIKMDYRWDGGTVVTAEEIEGGIRRLMAAENDEGRKSKTVKEVSEMSKKALMEGGSSCSSMSRFIQDVIDNIS
ncbi:unnamed protein product [Linum trigynum]|uniref:Glycosyltransferase n=1 Tax=Linum trigynum TaxID=586398 RepID=A0AAV2G0U5_9ROSI